MNSSNIFLFHAITTLTSVNTSVIVSTSPLLLGSFSSCNDRICFKSQELSLTKLLSRNTLIEIKYKGCSESNAFYFIMLAHDIRGGCWWYGSTGWTFPPTFHYILLPCDEWQQRDSVTKRHLTWKCGWRKGVSLNSTMQKKQHPLTFINPCWMFLETIQWMWAQWGGGWCVSAVATAGHLCWCR